MVVEYFSEWRRYQNVRHCNVGLAAVSLIHARAMKIMGCQWIGKFRANRRYWWEMIS